MVQMYQADNHYLISMGSFKTFSEAKEAVMELHKQYKDYTFEIVGAGVGGIGVRDLIYNIRRFYLCVHLLVIYFPT